MAQQQHKRQILTHHLMAAQIPDRVLAHMEAKVLTAHKQKQHLNQPTAVLMELKKLPPLGINQPMERQQ
jgi:hypothetical protein